MAEGSSELTDSMFLQTAARVHNNALFATRLFAGLSSTDFRQFEADLRLGGRNPSKEVRSFRAKRVENPFALVATGQICLCLPDSELERGGGKASKLQLLEPSPLLSHATANTQGKEQLAAALYILCLSAALLFSPSLRCAANDAKMSWAALDMSATKRS
jgi:hypothetical protein